MFGVEKVDAILHRNHRQFLQILFKMSASGDGMLYERSRLPKCQSLRPLHDANGSVDFDRFRRVCILSGCDYLPVGLPGVGLVKAVKFFSDRRVANSENAELEQVGVDVNRWIVAADPAPRARIPELERGGDGRLRGAVPPRRVHVQAPDRVRSGRSATRAAHSAAGGRGRGGDGQGRPERHIEHDRRRRRRPPAEGVAVRRRAALAAQESAPGRGQRQSAHDARRRKLLREYGWVDAGG